MKKSLILLTIGNLRHDFELLQERVRLLETGKVDKVRHDFLASVDDSEMCYICGFDRMNDLHPSC